MTIAIEQAIYGNPEPGGFRFLARSAGVADDWLPLAEKLCAGFGDRPAGVACPGCVFAQPFGTACVVVVQVADLGTDDAQRPGAIGFRLMFVPKEVYESLTGDPFLIADTFPPPWDQRGSLPVLAWPGLPVPRRTVAQVQQVLKNGDSATLLGGVQALIDSGRLLFERRAPDTELVRRLWLLLPISTRCHLWPASFAFANTLHFDVVVLPRAEIEGFSNYLREEQAGDYPEGRYELNLQIAAEAGDQAQLDALFSRRSGAETVRLAIYLLGIIAMLAVVMNVLFRPPSKPQSSPTTAAPPTLPQPPIGAPGLEAEYPPLNEETAQRASQTVRELIESLGPKPAAEAVSLSALLATLREQLAASVPCDPRKTEVLNRLAEGGKLQQPEAQVRAWLWLYDGQDHTDARRSLPELIEMLGKRVNSLRAKK
jgi:hypothetical protein